MTDDDLIRRGDALKITRDRWAAHMEGAQRVREMDDQSAARETERLSHFAREADTIRLAIAALPAAQPGKEVMPDDQGDTHARPATSPGVTAGAGAECRPIETAPKDGSWVLLWGGSACDGDECFSRSWTDPIRQAKQDADIAAINSRPVVARWEEENENYRGGAWAYAAWDSAWRSFYEEPTHWMPLPAVEVQNEAYAQRDLMIRANGLLEREIEKLTALLREARQDLEVYITNEYPKDQHPYYERQWNRDMELCRRIDAALKEVKDDPAA